MLSAEAIQRYYQNWNPPKHTLQGLTRKHIKIVSPKGVFISLNKLRNRINQKKLKEYCVEFKPLHTYMSIMDYLQPEKVLSKDRTLKAYPIRGSFVLDIDSYMNYQKHRHFTEPEGICLGCLDQAKELTIRMLDLVERDYKYTWVTFSGYHGFHIWVLDFKPRQWTYYDAGNPLKSHEVARRKYVEYLKPFEPRVLDKAHYILSCDVARVMTIPETLNGATGLVCNSYCSNDIRELSIHEIVANARKHKHVTTGNEWTVAADWKNPRFNLLSP